MFDDDLAAAAGDRKALADLAGAVEHDSRVAGCRKLVAAAAWADAHSAVDHPDSGPLVERLVRIGPVGIPPVAEFAAQGLAGPFDTSTGSARSWMVDALTIRHRLPRLWERVVAGEVHAWKARQVASLTGHLRAGVAGRVDEQTAPWVGQLPWRAFLRALDATMLQADEQTYRERERLAAAGRQVKATETQDGLRTLIARGEAGDVAMLLALYRRVAECLADEGDEDPLPVRMSKAIGIIANPARLTDLLLRHAADPDPHREPWEQVAAYQADETDPWADDLPAAGWQTAEHGIYHQPGPDDDWWWGHQPDPPAGQDGCGDWPIDPPPDPEDLAWYHRHTHPDHQPDAGPQHTGDHHPSGGERADGGGTAAAEPAGHHDRDTHDGEDVEDADTADRADTDRDGTGEADTREDGADGTGRDGTGCDDIGRGDTGRDCADRDDTGRDDTGGDGAGGDDTGRDGAGGDDTGRDGAGYDDTGRDDAGGDSAGNDGAGGDGAGCDATAARRGRTSADAVAGGDAGASAGRRAPTPWPEAFARPRWRPLTPAQAAGGVRWSV